MKYKYIKYLEPAIGERVSNREGRVFRHGGVGRWYPVNNTFVSYTWDELLANEEELSDYLEVGSTITEESELLDLPQGSIIRKGKFTAMRSMSPDGYWLIVEPRMEGIMSYDMFKNYFEGAKVIYREEDGAGW